MRYERNSEYRTGSAWPTISGTKGRPLPTILRVGKLGQTHRKAFAIHCVALQSHGKNVTLTKIKQRTSVYKYKQMHPKWSTLTEV